VCTLLFTVGYVGTVTPVHAAEEEAPPQPARRSRADSKKPDPGKPDKEGWLSLFDGRSLGKWKIVTEFDFERHGEVRVTDGQIVLEDGAPATGVKWTGDFPKLNYEVALEARRIEGSDFFCGMTFPVDDKSLTLVCGGWGGQVTGLSSIDGEPAVENDTCTYHQYKEKQWYRIRLRVRKEKIEAWLDDEQIVELPTKAREFSIYWEMEPALPFGICTWYTTGALKNIRVRSLDKKPFAKAQDLAPKPE
jgi:hypothetical protein